MFYENEFPKLNNNNYNLQQSRIYFKITLILGLVIKHISLKRKKKSYYFIIISVLSLFLSINQKYIFWWSSKLNLLNYFCNRFWFMYCSNFMLF